MSEHDIDRRFKELTSQIDAEERERMARAARREWAAHPRNRRRRRWRLTALVTAVAVAAAGGVIAYRPDLLEGVVTALSERLEKGSRPAPVPGPVPEETTPVKVSPFEGLRRSTTRRESKAWRCRRPRRREG
nr:hypothetical protein GCM10020093_111800 [Planobispora longispora]